LLTFIRYLWQHGKQIGNAALMTAVEEGHHELASILVANGANVNAIVRVRLGYLYL
jgi:hypothetical protein